MNHIIVSISFILLNIGMVFSQTFDTKKPLCGDCEKKIFLRVAGTSFFKNNEYFNNFTSGFTGIGFFLNPTIAYYLTPNTKADAGIYTVKYFGVDGFSQVIPTFSIHHKLTKNIELVFGSLYGTLNHKLDEPIFRFDNYYQKHVEYGFQFFWNSSSIQSELWLNWEKFIFKKDPFQEELSVGNSTIFTAFSSKKLAAYIPLQALITHKGGQIDSSPDPAFSIINGMTGLGVNYKITANSTLGIEQSVFLYQGWGLPTEGANSQLFNNGHGLYSKIKYDNTYLGMMLGYWSAHRFIAPKGEYLFQSVSELNDSFYEANRSLITGKIAFKSNVAKSFKIEARADGYYDTINKDFAYSYGLYLVFDELFFIGKPKIAKSL